MPFSRENIKFTVLTIGFVLLCVTGVAGVVAVSRGTSTNSTPLITAIISFVSIQAGQVLLMLRTEQAHSEISKTRHTLKNEQQATLLKVEEVEQKVEKNLPTTREELHALIVEVVSEILPRDREEIRTMVADVVRETCRQLRNAPG